jgi:hypothetical protein
MASLTKFTMPSADTVSPLRAMHSLRGKHVAGLAKVMAGLPAWSLECHEGYDGDLTVVLLPQNEGSDALVISRTADGFHLCTSRGDDYRSLGCFGSLEVLAAVAQATIATSAETEETMLASA